MDRMSIFRPGGLSTEAAFHWTCFDVMTLNMLLAINLLINFPTKSTFSCSLVHSFDHRTYLSLQFIIPIPK